MILTFHQCDGLGGVVEDADLIISTDQPAVLNADESDELPTLIETFKKFQYVSGEHGFIGGVGYAALLGVGIEVGVAEFYGDTRSQSVFAPQLEGQLVDHFEQHVFHILLIQGILCEGPFLGHGFLFAVGDDEAAVYAVGFFPQLATGISKLSLE